MPRAGSPTFAEATAGEGRKSAKKTAQRAEGCKQRGVQQRADIYYRFIEADVKGNEQSRSLINNVYERFIVLLVHRGIILV